MMACRSNLGDTLIVCSCAQSACGVYPGSKHKCTQVSVAKELAGLCCLSWVGSKGVPGVGVGELTLQCTGVISKGEHGSHRLVPANTDLLSHGSAKDLIWKGGFTGFDNSLSLFCAFDGALKSKYWLPLSLSLSLSLFVIVCVLTQSLPVCHSLSLSVTVCVSLLVWGSSGISVQDGVYALRKACMHPTPRLSEVSPMSPLKWFQCSSDWWWPSLILSRKII